MAKAAAKPKAARVVSSEVIEIFDMEQRSPEWFAARRGIVTASRFATMMASGRDGGDSIGRKKLMNILAGEILSGEPAESFVSEDMKRGIEMEGEARTHYANKTFAEIKQVGFIKRTITTPLGYTFTVGSSPDSLVGDDGGLEIKTMRPDLLIDLHERGAAGFPPEHRPQCQGTLWVSGRAWIDALFFYRGMPIAPKFRLERDDAYIARLAQEAEKFCWELDVLVKRIRMTPVYQHRREP